MGRHRRRGWASKLVGVIASLAAICAGIARGVEALPGARDAAASRGAGTAPSHSHWASNAQAPSPFCPSKSDFLLLVSTLDGSMSALDMWTNGEILWSVKGDDRPLLSSSITNIQVTKNGVPIRLIPSLDGGLYEFDGENVKAMPMTAESLLSSSMRLSDNSVMVGGKEVGSYGLDVKTGKMIYKCTSEGCKETSEANGGSGDLFLVTSNMQTVRAVDANSGIEKWNFSVGQHDLAFVASKKEKPGIEHKNSAAEMDTEDFTPGNCTPSGDEMGYVDEEQLKRLLKIVVSDGLIVGLNPEDPSQMSWSRKFSSPVAKAWIFHRGKLETVSLFDSRFVPALSSSHIFNDFNVYRENRDDPLLYVGTHKRQLYVQEEAPESNRCEQQVPWMLRQEEGQNALVSVPQVTWKPYLHKAGVQTPLFGGNEPPETPLLDEDGESDNSEHPLSVWHENYPFDMGYFLYPEHQEKPPSSKWQVPAEEGIMDVLPSLWMWWKEVLAISLVTSLFFHILFTRFVYRPVIENNSQGLDKKESGDSLISNDSNLALGEEKPATVEFKSRFADEFECIEQLGKGGFGIVFCAKNKVDEQKYAVKRIAVPNSDGAHKKKMLREVRTLAMLDHIGIVRYFHSWIEDPPPGWQEERDKEFDDTFGSGDGLGPTVDISIVSTDQTHKSEFSDVLHPSAKQQSALRKPPSLLANIMPFANGNIDLNSQLFPKSSTGSGEFSVHSNMEVLTDESGSFSLGGDDNRSADCAESKDSFSVVFQNSDAESSISRDISEGLDSGQHELPFTHYRTGQSRSKSTSPESDADLNVTDTSCSIVFEDSHDNAEKNDSKVMVCTDSSYGGSVDDNESGGNDNVQNNQCTVDFTLSSHRQKDNCISEAKEERHKRAVVPKLYLYLQMQLCRLETLKDWLMANTLNRERSVTLDIFEQIVSAVDYIHANGLIHRDLKPSNIFFALDGTVKVGDFGLVTAAENQPESSDQPPQSKAATKHTADVGTQLYMSPEQVHKKPYDQKVDVFSLGLIFLELLMPFSTGMERTTTLQSARKGLFPERFCRELPTESKLVKQLMSADPEKRPTTRQVLEHSLLTEFCPRRVGFRYRTISGSSSHSDHLQPLEH